MNVKIFPNTYELEWIYMYIKVGLYNISSKICSSTINVLQGKLYLKRKYKIIGDKKDITGSDILIFPQSLYKY